MKFNNKLKYLIKKTDKNEKGIMITTIPPLECLKTGNPKCWQGCGATERTALTWWWECKLVQTLWEIYSA